MCSVLRAGMAQTGCVTCNVRSSCFVRVRSGSMVSTIIAVKQFCEIAKEF